MIDFGVRIPEVVAVDVVAIFKYCVGDGLGKKVEIGSSEGKRHGSSFFPKGSLKGDFACEGTEVGVTRPLIFIAVYGLNRNHTAEATAVFGRKASAIHLCAFDDIAVENTKNSIEVIGIEHGDIIEKNQILVCCAAAHIHP